MARCLSPCWLVLIVVAAGCSKPSDPKPAAAEPQAQPHTTAQPAADHQLARPTADKPSHADSKPVSAAGGRLAPGEKKAASRPDVGLKLVDLSDLDAALARHKGKVLLVDVWAMW